MSSASPSRSLDEIASQQLLIHLRRLRRTVVPSSLAMALVLVAVDPASWRHALTVVGLSAVTAAIMNERRKLETPRSVALTMVMGGFAQMAIVFELGGLASPLLPVLVVFALVSNVVAPSNFGIFFTLGIQVPVVWIYAFVHHYGWIPELVPSAWDGLFAEPGTPGPGPFLGAGFITMMIVTSMAAGRLLRAAMLKVVRDQLARTTAELETHAEATRTLTRLSAEIAHELKNPLASVKGLSALVARDLEGKTAERMDVLRREVDRMQAILEEFLTYSRPLVPLAPEDVDLATVVRDVITLHEAMAAQRGVELLAKTSEPVRLRCDPRKVRQVLLNVVQNAIEATPAKGKVRLALVVRENDVSLLVDDEGSGLGELEPGRVFDVGFTTKDTGSGIGLAVARGLARQHGGELVLERRDEGGCRARLVLPRTLPEEPS
ncbi:MAG: HAMP domain-containing histidine kinase [Sandaracinus sp.]|nr:HAMP domain-containing histidine kinase [Sandaracinus sp.]